MKFTDGYWKQRDDCLLFQAVNVIDYTYTDGEFTLYAGTSKGASVKDVGGTVLTVRVFSPARDVIGVDICHHAGQVENFTRLVDAGSSVGAVTFENGVLTITSGKTAARIDTAADWNLEYFYGGGFLTRSGWRSVGWGRFASVNDTGAAYVKEELSLSVGENVYGFGERFGNFIKNGQVIETWNQDGGTSSQQAYKAIPFYMTNRNYGVFVDDSGAVSFEVASEKVERVQFSATGERLRYYIIGGKNPKEVLSAYTALTGRPALPPAWSFGLWLTTSFTTDYNEAVVTSFVNGMAERDIPLAVFHFDCFWMKGGRWCGLEWDEDAFPRPEKMLKRLKERGLKICVWINPYIAQRAAMFDEGVKNGYFLKRQDGSVWQTDDWQPGLAIVDFTNPNAREWYAAALKRLLDMGVDTFKTDFGERIPTEARFHSGEDPTRMHNKYTYIYNKTVFELLLKERGEGEALVFARSACAGGQKFPVHWGGDCFSSYESMAESLRGGLSLTASGFGFWSHDISGFESTASPDLYKRWLAFGMFSTHSRLHGNSSYRVPWLFDDESVDVARFFALTKCRLMPYLYSEAVRTSRTGVPMMRALFIDFPEDPTAAFLDRQYMFGASLLVAPVFSPDGQAEYYVPGDGWTGFFDNRPIGGGWRREKHSYMSLPVAVKPNSIIPMADETALTEYDYLKDVCFYWFGAAKGEDAAYEVFAAGAGESGILEAKWDGDYVTLTASGFRGKWRVCLVNIHDVTSVTGAAIEKGERGVVITASEDTAAVTVTL